MRASFSSWGKLVDSDDMTTPAQLRRPSRAHTYQPRSHNEHGAPKTPIQALPSHSAPCLNSPAPVGETSDPQRPLENPTARFSSDVSEDVPNSDFSNPTTPQTESRYSTFSEQESFPSGMDSVQDFTVILSTRTASVLSERPYSGANFRYPEEAICSEAGHSDFYVYERPQSSSSAGTILVALGRAPSHLQRRSEFSYASLTEDNYRPLVASQNLPIRRVTTNRRTMIDSLASAHMRSVYGDVVSEIFPVVGGLPVNETTMHKSVSGPLRSQDTRQDNVVSQLESSPLTRVSTPSLTVFYLPYF